MVSPLTAIGHSPQRTDLSECIGKVQRLQEGVQIACSALILQADKARLPLGIVIIEVVPQDTRLIFYDTDICSDVARILFDERATRGAPGLLEHASELEKSGEAPITLLLGKAMMRGMMGKKRRIVDIPHDQAKLYAATPVIWHAAKVVEAMLQVYRGLVNIIAKREEKDAPVQRVNVSEGANY